MSKMFRRATGDSPMVQQNWFQKNQKAIIIGGALILAALIFVPDVYIRKYVPFVK